MIIAARYKRTDKVHALNLPADPDSLQQYWTECGRQIVYLEDWERTVSERSALQAITCGWCKRAV